jgi:hypothetical protein
MSTKPNNLESWKLGTHEVAYYSPSKGDANASALKVYIPKIMPLVPFGTPKQIVVPLSKSCLLNADKCKPSIASMTKTQNYLTVKSFSNNNFKHSLFDHGAELIVEVPHGDVDSLRVTNKEDNSYDPQP